MDKRIKIVLVVIIFLGIVSGIFLIVMKMKNPTNAETQKNVATSSMQQGAVNHLGDVQANSIQSTTTQTNGQLPVQTATVTVATPNIDDQSKVEWQACSKKTAKAGDTYYWKVSVTESIPQGGTYAKANLLGLSTMPIRITIKATSSDATKIKDRLVAGKDAIVRGTCTGTNMDGSVSFEAF